MYSYSFCNEISLLMLYSRRSISSDAINELQKKSKMQLSEQSIRQFYYNNECMNLYIYCYKTSSQDFIKLVALQIVTMYLKKIIFFRKKKKTCQE